MVAKKKKTGRPRKEVNAEHLEKLCVMQCTDEEIAAFFRVSRSTITRLKLNPEYTEIFENAKERGKMSLRRMQIEAAQKGNTTMLIWLGKQYLGQKDRLESTGADGSPLIPAAANVAIYLPSNGRDNPD